MYEYDCRRGEYRDAYHLRERQEGERDLRVVTSHEFNKKPFRRIEEAVGEGNREDGMVDVCLEDGDGIVLFFFVMMVMLFCFGRRCYPSRLRDSRDPALKPSAIRQ